MTAIRGRSWGLSGLWDDPWCIGGDFNVTRFPSERSRGGRLAAAMRRFLEVDDELTLRDLPLHGGPFTWNGGLNGQTMSRLDRFLVFEDWESRFSGVVQSTLSRSVSNHYPILLDGGGVRRVKLKALKGILKIWNKEVFGKVEVNKSLALQQLRRGRFRGVFVSAFQHLLLDPGDWCPSWDGLVFDRLAGEEAARLEETFFVEEGGVEDLRDFRCISLVGGLYKLLAKVLANRLKKVVGKVVSSSQNVFVEGRQILDAVLIANEAIDSLLKSNECELPRVETRGPLSPYLFVTGMEALSCLIKRAVSGGLFNRLQGEREGGEGVQLTHLLYANDTPIFCEAFKDQLTHLSWVLMWFEAISGLRINLDKIEILPVGRVDNLEELALELRCKVGMLSSSYLGLPLGAPHKSVAVWDGGRRGFGGD
ncbi:hypothetical protein CK203_097801 [Vitis vinifera]|uniref:Reverse transcriptase domain-containing protein n=1 Tax=Vitis vinifera TaxID=29760 RepID=A0A438D4Y2_VITVI|nr:hypothetical protein CK203_097801 [Vitis vinifera]